MTRRRGRGIDADVFVFVRRGRAEAAIAHADLEQTSARREMFAHPLEAPQAGALARIG
jgi:hypothetical protein